MKKNMFYITALCALCLLLMACAGGGGIEAEQPKLDEDPFELSSVAGRSEPPASSSQAEKGEDETVAASTEPSSAAPNQPNSHPASSSLQDGTESQSGTLEFVLQETSISGPPYTLKGTLINETNDTVSYHWAFEIQRQIGGEWVSVPVPNDVADTLPQLAPGEKTMDYPFLMQYNENMEPGKYRILLSSMDLSAEFAIIE